MRRRDDEEVTRIINARRASRKERKSMKSKKIDFSDIPELSDKQLSQYAKRDSSGRHYTTSPLHAPGAVRDGATGGSWRGMLPQAT